MAACLIQLIYPRLSILTTSGFGGVLMVVMYQREEGWETGDPRGRRSELRSLSALWRLCSLEGDP